MTTISCKYSCVLCGLRNVAVAVKAREEEQVTEWMDRTCVPTIMADHHQRSPQCYPESLTNIMIPVTGADRIGGPNLQ